MDPASRKQQYAIYAAMTRSTSKHQESPDPRPPSMLQFRGDPPTSSRCRGPPHSPAGSLGYDGYDGYDLSFCNAEWTSATFPTLPPSFPSNATHYIIVFDIQSYDIIIQSQNHISYTMFLIFVYSIDITAVCMHMCPSRS